MTDFHPDGPHSPEQTITAAEQVAELVRYLALATRSGQDGLSKPGDLYAVLGALIPALERFPQLCGQLAASAEAWHATGSLRDTGDADPGGLSALVRWWLDNASNRSGEMAAALRQAQNAATGLYLKGDDEDA